MLIASAILAFSVLMFARFGIAYCHSIIVSCEREALSPATLQMAHLSDENVSAADFRRIMSLIALCPFEAGDRASLRSVQIYFLALSTFSPLRMPAPVWWRWIRAERNRCAQFAAAALDRRVRADVTSIT